MDRDYRRFRAGSGAVGIAGECQGNINPVYPVDTGVSFAA